MKSTAYMLFLSLLVPMTLMALISLADYGVWWPLAVLLPVDIWVSVLHGRAVEEGR